MKQQNQVITDNKPMYASTDQLRAFANQPPESIVSSHAQEMLFIIKNPERTALNPSKE